MPAKIVIYDCGAPFVPALISNAVGLTYTERTDRIMPLIEAGFVLVALLLAFVAPRIASSFFTRIEQHIVSVARHRRVAVVIVGVVALALRGAVLPILPVPAPSGHDEFSYLLMADTFVHGRLTNPTPPLWIHFESVNVIFHPTYCSMYYPAQGAVLAIGELLGNPFWGVWLSIGSMCAAICWMLQAWVGPFWAFMGGLLAAIRLGTFSYWANGYMGGAVAAIGGALVLGALPRFKRRQRASDALILGCGFAMLIGTRPFEGLFFSIPIVCYLSVWILRNNKKITFCRSFYKLVLPSGVILLVTVGFMLYYFWRTTDRPLLPPYVVSLRTYSAEPSFPWLPEHPAPHYNHEVLRRYWTGFNFNGFHLVREHPFFSVVIRFVMLWFFFLGPLLSLPFLALAFVLPYGTSLKDIPPNVRLLLLVCGATFAGMLLPVYVSPHYAAPMTAAIYVLLMLAMQRVRRWQAGPLICRAVMVGAVGLLLVRVAAPVFNLPLVNPNRPDTWCSPSYQLITRQTLEKGLEAKPGKHVVFVRYGLNESSRDDSVWVNNLADIDGSRVVWAHDMGPRNEELIRHFAGRKFWLLEVDRDPARFSEYESFKNPATLSEFNDW